MWMIIKFTHPDIAMLVTPLCCAKEGMDLYLSALFTPQAKRGRSGAA